MNLNNGNRPRGEFPSAGQPQAQKEMKPEDYTLEANQKAAARTGYVSQVALAIFLETWKAMLTGHNEEPSQEELGEAMDDCLKMAELWRQKVNNYQVTQAEDIHNARVQRAAKSNLIVPTWGEIKDHFPGGMVGGGLNLG